VWEDFFFENVHWPKGRIFFAKAYGLQGGSFFEKIHSVGGGFFSKIFTNCIVKGAFFLAGVQLAIGGGPFPSSEVVLFGVLFAHWMSSVCVSAGRSLVVKREKMQPFLKRGVFFHHELLE
jgi:hypothetical protein